jgi:hypothetical protein
MIAGWGSWTRMMILFDVNIGWRTGWHLVASGVCLGCLKPLLGKYAFTTDPIISFV